MSANQRRLSSPTHGKKKRWRLSENKLLGGKFKNNVQLLSRVSFTLPQLLYFQQNTSRKRGGSTCCVIKLGGRKQGHGLARLATIFYILSPLLPFSHMENQKEIQIYILSGPKYVSVFLSEGHAFNNIFFIFFRLKNTLGQ